jgi:hypothetical protein
MMIGLQTGAGPLSGFVNGSEPPRQGSGGGSGGAQDCGGTAAEAEITIKNVAKIMDIATPAGSQVEPDLL